MTPARFRETGQSIPNQTQTNVGLGQEDTRQLQAAVKKPPSPGVERARIVDYVKRFYKNYNPKYDLLNRPGLRGGPAAWKGWGYASESGFPEAVSV